MLGINLVRDHPDVILADLNKREDTEKVKYIKKVQEIDEAYRSLLHEAQRLRQKRNTISREIAQLKKAGKDASALLKEAADIPQRIQEIEIEQNQLKQKIDYYLMRLPNILHESVPVGKDDTENQLIEKVGKKPSYTFDLKSHVDILNDLNLVDLERAAKISGARFWFLKNEALMLDFALQKYALDFMVQKGFSVVQPPFMMNKKAYEGVTDLKDFEDVMYKIADEDLYLIATSEHPLTAMYTDEILEAKDLPLTVCGISTNFRKEAGAHGKDQKGIFRGHQFNKIEQIVICDPADSWKFHEQILGFAKDFFASLGLHFRVVAICTGDIGTVAAKKYDIEVWYPVQNAYREVVSCSNCTDYQARRLKIRVRGKEKNSFVHTLNSTLVATSRAVAAILENNQQKDGSVKIPDVLVPYMNGLKVIKHK
jgi:seryl-tRNA synthetase